MNADSHSTLGDRELDIMQALWRLGRPATVAEVHRTLAGQGHAIAYNTVQTILNRLEAKGQLEREKGERAHRYAARRRRGEAADDAVERVLERFFDGSAEALATRLVEKMDRSEIARVRALIDKAKTSASEETSS